MTKFLLTASAVALSATGAFAGGFERSGNPVGFMFEKGNYAELTFGYVRPSVSGTIAGGALSSGSAIENYTQLGFAIKTDLTDKISLGLQLDPSFGADILYPTGTGYPLAGTNAELNGDSITLIGRYKFNENFSAHAGIKSVGLGGNLAVLVGGGPAFPPTSYETDRDVGYLAGVAYERPDIALRVALTYYSNTKHSLATTLQTAGGPVAGATQLVELPQSVTLDFQTGVAANTLVFGSIRWADWTETALNFPAPGLVAYDNDVFTYNIGVGRKFSEQWSGAVSLGYERREGGISTNLAPTDGFVSVGLGATYTMENVKITGGVRYIDIGDAQTNVPVGPGATTPSSFAGNDAVAIGIKVGYTF
jgi:long-chain fatty acid transport protein